MVSFKENFFFFRFSVLFFILVIFGYWGLDLNSEELYIAFSFFIFVVVVFVLVRNGVLFFFVKAVNAKYTRILSDLLLIVASLRLQVSTLLSLDLYLSIFLKLVKQFVVFLIDFVNVELPVFSSMYVSKFLLLQSMLVGSMAIFTRSCIKVRRSAVFLGKFFDISL